MTRTARGIAVFTCLLAFAGGTALAGDSPTTSLGGPDGPPKIDADPKPEPPAFPTPLPPQAAKKVGFFSLVPPPPGKDDKLNPKERMAIAETFSTVNQKVSDVRMQAQRQGKTEAEQVQAMIADPKVNQALAEARDVVADPRMPPAAREQVASAMVTTGNFGDALALSQQTLKQDPDNRDALANISQARYSLGQYRQAIEDATRLAQMDPTNETAYTTRALSRYYSGDFVAAAEDARRALALNKNNDIAVATLRMAETKVQPSQIKLAGVSAQQADRIKAEYQLMLEQRNQVEGEVARTVAAAPADPATGRTAAKIASEDHWGAIEDSSKAIAANPANAEAWYQRAAARNMAGEHQQAAADASEAIRLAPGHAPAFDARARANLALGKFNEATADATQSIRLEPSNAYPFAIRARAFEKLGDKASAVADLQQAARRNRQFQAEYERAAAKYALPPAPRSEPLPEPAKPAGRPVWFLILSSIIGGTLVAVGLFHIFSAQWNRKITTALKRLEEARGNTPLPPDLGQLTSHFQMLRIIGRGGMGVVYEAVDRGLNRRVALKRMRDEIRIDARERERFIQEARTVASLHHPNIVDIHAIVEEAGELCLVFEHVSGRTVEQLLEAKTRLSLAEARHIFRGVCQALEYAHRRGVVHRDLKPSNVMLTDDGEIKVMDFGIARHAKDALSRMTVTNTVAGTPPYMPPEAEQGVIRPETDVYGLGACLYEMLTGERPFPNQATTSAKLSMSYPKPTRLRGDLPAAVDALIDGALQPDPDKRISSAAKFLAQMEAAFSVPA